jgi:hypothetical protein
MDPKRFSLQYTKEYGPPEERKKEIFLNMKQSGRKPQKNNYT